MKNRILAGMAAAAIVVTAWLPASRVQAEESVLTTAVNTSFAAARDLPFGTSIAEEMSDSDTKRYYKFTLDEASELNLGATIDAKTATVNISVYDASKTQVYFFQKWHSNWTNDFSTGSIYLTGGAYYLGIEMDYSPCAISFIVNSDSLGESFVETQDSNNDMFSDASPILLKKKYKGVLANNDEIDYYKFEVPAAGTITYNMTNAANGTLKYVIYDSSMNASYTKTVNSSGKTAEMIPLAEGTYYLAVAKENSEKGVGSYNFTMDYVAKVPDAPVIKSIKNTSGKKMKAAWDKVSDAEGYELQYSTSSGFKSGVVTKKLDASKTSAACSGLTKGKTCYVRLRSYVTVDGVKKYSKWSAKKSVKINK